MPNEEIVCCLELPTRLNCHSPFLDDCSTSYYDGSIEGITRCAVCSRVYRYGIVAWNDDPEDVEVKIFLFNFLIIASPPNQSLKSIVRETRNIKLQESKFTLVLAAKYFQKCILKTRCLDEFDLKKSESFTSMGGWPEKTQSKYWFGALEIPMQMKD
jgi:hypothetical protein